MNNNNILLNTSLDNYTNYDGYYQYIPVVFGDFYDNHCISSLIPLTNATDKNISVSAVYLSGGSQPGGTVTITKYKFGFSVTHENSAMKNQTGLVVFTVS